MRLSILLYASTLLLTAVSPSSAQQLVERAIFTGHALRVWQTALSPDGKLLASMRGDDSRVELKLWDVATSKEMAELDGYTADPVTLIVSLLGPLIFSPDSRKLASSSGTGIRVWDVASRKPIGPDRERVAVVGFSRDSKQVAMATGSQELTVWDLTTGNAVASSVLSIPLHHLGLMDRLRLMVFSGDLATVAVPNFQEIDLWDVATGKLRATLSEHRGAVNVVKFSADGGTLIAASSYYYGKNSKWHGDVKLWDVATAKERLAFKGPFGRVQVAALSPDGRILALLDSPVVGADPVLKLADAATGRQQTIPSVPGHSFTSLAFTTDGRLFVIGTTDDKTVKLWEVLLPK
jgi:WD40 repeat protein